MKIHIAVVAAILFCAVSVRAQQAVTVTDDGATYTLDNGIVQAMVAKASGDLVSFKYKNLQMLATIVDDQGRPDLKKDPPGENREGLNRGMTDHQYGFWSHDAMGPRGTGDAIASITIDPKSNGGERGEVGVKGISNGRLMGTGPGAGTPGNFYSDIEIRWALGRGDSGVYTYCQFNHPASYPATTITEARFCMKLADFFDWMSVAQDDHHNKLYPSTLREGDKYIYTADQYNNRAFGWSSTTKNVGMFIINPSMEYMSGGPTKIEFLGHRDTNQVASPCVLDYWRSSHYGGADVTVKADEAWTKVVGPFMIYATSGGDSQAIYADARAQAVVQEKKWPFDWVSGVDYPSSKDRATVKGQLVLNDSQMPGAKLPNLMVGLTAPAYALPALGAGRGPAPEAAARGPAPVRTIDWQQDAKHYEFWVRGQDDGQFEIPSVRPGTYTMHAFADGVLGEFAQANVAVVAGTPLDLGKVNWTPVRHGKQVWDIGIPNRNGSEFLDADVYWKPGIGQEYATLFPNDLTYTIGKSDFHKDCVFQHVPHYDPAAAPPPNPGRGFGRGPATGPALGRGAGPASAPAFARGGAPATGPAGARRGNIPGFAPATYGRATPYTIVFNMPNAPRGKATLRFALAATGTNTLDVAVNGQPAGQVGLGFGDGVLSDHGTHGIWREHELAFDASLMKQGENKMTLTVPAGATTAGLIYDYLRLELDEAAVASAR